MTAEMFFDTNILVYAFDSRDQRKHAVAVQLLSEVKSGNLKGVISNQTLFELFLILTRKLNKSITEIMAENLVEGLIETVEWKKINYTYKTIVGALHIIDKYKTSFVDTVIASTMLENGVKEIFTEDKKDFEKIPGIKPINPFKA